MTQETPGWDSVMSINTNTAELTVLKKHTCRCTQLFLPLLSLEKLTDVAALMPGGHMCCHWCLDPEHLLPAIYLSCFVYLFLL